jgi:hypothetical protein
MATPYTTANTIKQSSAIRRSFYVRSVSAPKARLCRQKNDTESKVMPIPSAQVTLPTLKNI